MSAKHTPGPWIAHHYGIRDVGGYIVSLHWPQRYEGQDERYIHEIAEREADARLIAAAPDLLAALQAMLEDFGVPETSVFSTASIVNARAAIKKATEQS